MVDITPEITELLKQQGGQDLERCYQCGTCTAVCPWNIAGHLGVRNLIHQAQMGLVDFGDDEIWKCVGCRSCAQACPRGVDIPKMIRAVRRVISEVGAGSIPRSLRTVAANLAGVGNPLGEPSENRNKWASEAGARSFQPGMEMLLFNCCYQTYDSRCRKAAQSMLKVLSTAGADYGILTDEVTCCGESIRKTGKEALFASLAARNIQAFKSAGVHKILVSSPHCYNAFKEDYPEFGSDFEIIHIVQYLDKSISNGRIKLSKKLDLKVAYHDSCCLGRYQGIYEEPRRILRSIPGIELIELPDNRANSMCCGGCSGGLWMESKSGERFSELRINQALECGAKVLAVSCPYCMTMFEDAVLSLDKSDSIKVIDVVELVQESAELT